MNSLVAGTWKLKSFEVKKENGEIVYPFGEDVTGMVIYTDTGNFSIQYMPRVQTKGIIRGISYFGTYEYNREKEYILHHVESSFFENREGHEKLRFAKVVGKKLTLTCPPLGDEEESKLVITIEFEKQDEIPQSVVTQPLIR